MRWVQLGESLEISKDLKDYFKNITKYYKPAEPISQAELFVGRESEKTLLYKSLLAGGRFPIIYGVRGVGKTSLLNITCKYFCDKNGYTFIKHICSSRDNFQSIFNTFLRSSSTNTKVDKQVNKTNDDTTSGLNISILKFESKGSDATETTLNSLTDTLLSPSLLSEIFKEKKLLLIIDEFEQIKDLHEKALISETIKALSDNQSKTKIIISGVGNSLNELVLSHQSTSRNLVSIEVPRMTNSELLNIISNGTSSLKIKFDEEILSNIVWLSDGLPYFTHLICECLADYAFYSDIKHLTLNDFEKVLSNVIENMALKEVVVWNYKNAFSDSRKRLFQSHDTLFGQPIDTYSPKVKQTILHLLSFHEGSDLDDLYKEYLSLKNFDSLDKIEPIDIELILETLAKNSEIIYSSNEKYFFKDSFHKVYTRIKHLQIN